MQCVRTIEVFGKRVEYTLKKKRKQRSYSLTVYKSGRIVLTIPYVMSLESGERYMRQKLSWVKKVAREYPSILARQTVQDRRKEYLECREKAREFVTKRLAELNSGYGFQYNRISIRLNTSRWGSCSDLKNLNFDYRIIFLSQPLQDYLLVHELCHTQEMNHSARFWTLVAQAVPNYKVLRRELKGVVF